MWCLISFPFASSSPQHVFGAVSAFEGSRRRRLLGLKTKEAPTAHHGAATFPVTPAMARRMTTAPAVLSNEGISSSLGAFFLTSEPFAVVPLGDLNRDGRADYGVSIFGTANQVGVVLGGASPSITNGFFLPVLNVTGASFLGHGLTAAGDLNDDGAVDMVAGSIVNMITVLLLRASGALLHATMYNSSSPSMPVMRPDARCGVGMGLLGHLNGDRYPEILMGCDADALPTCGVHTLFLGKGGVIAGHASNWCDAAPLAGVVSLNSSLGHALGGIGDVDGDGLVDAAYGAHSDTASSSGGGSLVIGFLNSDGSIRSALALSKSSGGAVVNAHLAAFAPGWKFAQAVSGLGDVDGDGVPDVAVGSPFSGNTLNSGRVDVLFLHANGTVKDALVIGEDSVQETITQLAVPGAQLGWSVWGAGNPTGGGAATLGVFGRGLPDAAGSLLYISLGLPAPVKSTSWVGAQVNPAPLVRAVQPLAANVSVAFGRQSSAVQRSTLLGDVNGDGFLDMAFADFTDGEIYILMGGGDGAFGGASALIHPNGTNFDGPLLPTLNTFGHGITLAGDADLNGVPDLYVGFLEAGPPALAGALWLLLLQADGSLKQALQVTQGMPAKIAGAKCGYGVGSLGDTNADGYQEVLLGCGWHPAGDSFAYLLYMALGGRVAKWVKHDPTGTSGIVAGDTFGYAFAALGDLDGNGHLDYACLAQEGSKLSVQLLRLNGSVLQFVITPATSEAFTGFISTQGSEHLGISLTAAGDLNGDGVFDLVMGASEQLPNGAMYVVFMNSDGTVLGGRSSETPLDGLAAVFPNISSTSGFGASVTWLGDLVGDGNLSVVVSSTDTVSTAPPVIMTLELPAAPLVAQRDPPLLTLTGIPASSAISTFTPSGLPLGPLSIGLAVEYNATSVSNFSTPADRMFGAAVIPMGDLNGDGVADIVVGAPADNGEGTFVIVFMAADGTPLNVPCPVVPPSFGEVGAFGACICAHGFLDLPFVSGLLFGAPLASGGKGRVTFSGIDRHGSVTGFNHSAEGATSDSRLGSSCAVLGDLNGDGRSDIAVGAPGVLGVFEGTVQVRLTQQHGTLSTLELLAGPSSAGQELSEFGSSLAALGDVDGNGIPDMAVGEPFADYGGITDSGSITVVYLMTGGSELSRVVLHAGNSIPFAALLSGASPQLGMVMAPAGDLNGDGTLDILLGTPGYNSGRGGFGIVLMGNGGSGSIRGVAPVGTAYPSGLHSDVFAAGGDLGRGLAGLGDLDGDGFVDFGLGQPAPVPTPTSSCCCPLDSRLPPGTALGPCGSRTSCAPRRTLPSNTAIIQCSPPLRTPPTPPKQ